MNADSAFQEVLSSRDSTAQVRLNVKTLRRSYARTGMKVSPGMKEADSSST